MDGPRYTLAVRVEIRDRQGYSGGGLTLKQDLEFGAADFSVLAAVLSKFHELAETIKEQAKTGTVCEVCGQDFAAPICQPGGHRITVKV